jgi:hypothetical protein
VQRLKQHNLGARLRLNDSELLIAQGPALPDRATLRRVRMRFELAGYGEWAYHEIGRRFSVFSHRSVELDAARVAEIAAALRAAWLEHPRGETEADPQRQYRTVEFRDGDKVRELRVEYDAGLPRPAAPAFEAAWRLLEQQFPEAGRL